MATFMEVDRVHYLAASGVSAPLCRLYFCRHCLKLRSSDCVSHEVDSHYCSNCLENMPSAEAKLKKNRCANCFDCPSCHHTLSTRATSVAVPNPDDPQAKATPRKVYYLACGFCRWTSRDVAMKDQIVASGGWQEQENENAKRIGVVLDYYRQLALKEKAEKEKKKYIHRRSYLHLSDKYGLSAIAARRRSGMLGMGNLSVRDEDKLPDVDASVASEEVEALPDDIYTQPVSLTQVTSIDQRHSNPEFQPDSVTNMYPVHKHLLIKRSQRCRECEHNLSKPEFNPASIKFKIQLVALHHVPEMRIMSPPNLQFQKETQVILTIFNPLDYLTHVTLLPNDKKDDKSTTAKVELPNCEILLSPRDDAAEFDDSSDQQQGFKDDPSVVVFRKSNKLGFFVKVIPQEADKDAKISFILRYDYKNMTTALQQTGENKEPETVWLQHYVYINLGRLATQ